jgi:hypothetical protein
VVAARTTLKAGATPEQARRRADACTPYSAGPSPSSFFQQTDAERVFDIEFWFTRRVVFGFILISIDYYEQFTVTRWARSPPIGFDFVYY